MTILKLMNFGLMFRKKRTNSGLYYVYDRGTQEIITYVWGKRDLRTAKKLRK